MDGLRSLPTLETGGNVTDWTFWCATTDQGLLFYYYDRLMNQAHIQKGTSMSGIFTHFVGQNKPFLYSPETIEDVPKRYKGAVVAWYELWDQVKAKMESTPRALKRFRLVWVRPNPSKDLESE